ncbi:MAG: CBS domain-containing protein [Solirubrobacteraceae bacterium]|nr:CBS domain-containing protein [Solirubrobacteraceae bacterium]
MEIREVMTRSVVTAAVDAPVREVAELMRERSVGSVVLTDAAGAVAALVTDRDLTVSVLAAGRDPGEAVAEHASTPVIGVAPGDDVAVAARRMIEFGIRRLPVLDGEILVGIVALDDLAARTGDSELAHQLTAQVAKTTLPDFYFFDRGG